MVSTRNETKTAMKSFSTLFFGAIVLASSVNDSNAQSATLDPEIIKFVDEVIVKEFLPRTGISKLGLTIVQDDGKTLYTTGYGYADEEKGILNGNNTQFLIGSVTKSFTSTVVAKTLNELFPELGESVMDSPVRKLIPSTNFTLIDRFRSEHATFRDLLGHRLCIPRNDYQLVAEPFSSASEVVYRERYSKEICGVRSELQYNNQMYVIAGELIGMLANKSFPELLEKFLADLGMNNSKLVSQSDDFSNMPLRAQPYYVMDSKSFPINPDLIKRITLHNAAGGLYAPPNDMARYMRFHLNKGSIDGQQIVPENVMGWLVKPAMLVNGYNHKNSDQDLIFTTFGYGSGLFLSSFNGWQQIEHSGSFPPYTSQMSLYPEKNLAIFTSTNEGPIYVHPVTLHSFIFETLRGALNVTAKFKAQWEKQAASTIEKQRTKNKAMDAYIEETKKNTGHQIVDNIVGKYGSGNAGDAEISERFNNATNATGLYLSHGKWSKGWLEVESAPIYKVFWETDVVQDNYASGDPRNFSYARIQNGTLEFIAVDIDDNVYPQASFQLGLTLDNLPVIPWLPNSCG